MPPHEHMQVSKRGVHRHRELHRASYDEALRLHGDRYDALEWLHASQLSYQRCPEKPLRHTTLRRDPVLCNRRDAPRQHSLLHETGALQSGRFSSEGNH